MGGAEAEALAARLDAVERAQERLAADVAAVQAVLARVQLDAAVSSVKENGVGTKGGDPHGDVTVVEVQNGEGEGEGQGEFKSAAEMAIEELQKKVDGIVETIRLECVLLSLPSFFYPAC